MFGFPASWMTHMPSCGQDGWLRAATCVRTMTLEELTSADLASLAKELGAFRIQEDELIAAARDDVVLWKFADRTPNTLVPAGRLEVLNFDLYQTGEFVNSRPVFAESKSDECSCRLGYNEIGQLRYEDFGSPLIWCYSDSAITELKLKRGEHSSFARADLVDGTITRAVRVARDSVTERHFSAEGNVDTILERMWLRDEPHEEFALSDLSTRHEATFNSKGKLKFVVTSFIKGGAVISRFETLKRFFFNEWFERKLET